MRRSCLLLPCLMIVALPAGALAQQAKGDPESPAAGGAEADSRDEAGVPAPGPEAEQTSELDLDQGYDGLLHDALLRLVQRDAAAAERLLRAAADQDSSRPEAFCHLGDAQRLAGQLEEAVRSYQSCTRFADTAGNARYARIGRSNEAITLERMEGRREQARAVYETLSATEDPAESHAWTLASERLKALAAAGLLETVYAEVRVRIKEREAQKDKKKK